MNIAVIVPVLNERPNLPACIASIRRSIPGARIIAADGGSTDGSLEWLASDPGIAVVTHARGKGPQQNAGAALAGDAGVLVFLHADCELPPDAGAQITAALRDPHSAGGAFFVRFAEARPRSLHFLAWGMNTRLVLLRRCFGDQGIFVRRELFHKVQGFPAWPLFEDYELVHRIKAQGRFAAVRSPLTLNARRFLRHGVWRTVLRVFVLQFAYYCGVAPARLKEWFADIRPHVDAKQDPVALDSE